MARVKLARDDQHRHAVEADLTLSSSVERGAQHLARPVVTLRSVRELFR